MFGDKNKNFLSLERFQGLHVLKGQNNLDTCFQYVVKHATGKQLLNVKIYDKVIDLFAREGTQHVGSRIKQILGSKRNLSIFEKRLCTAQYRGMTRLEVSICRGAFQEYRPQ